MITVLLKSMANAVVVLRNDMKSNFDSVKIETMSFNARYSPYLLYHSVRNNLPELYDGEVYYFTSLENLGVGRAEDYTDEFYKTKFNFMLKRARRKDLVYEIISLMEEFEGVELAGRYNPYNVFDCIKFFSMYYKVDIIGEYFGKDGRFFYERYRKRTNLYGDWKFYKNAIDIVFDKFFIEHPEARMDLPWFNMEYVKDIMTTDERTMNIAKPKDYKLATIILAFRELYRRMLDLKEAADKRENPYPFRLGRRMVHIFRLVEKYHDLLEDKNLSVDTRLEFETYLYKLQRYVMKDFMRRSSMVFYHYNDYIAWHKKYMPKEPMYLGNDSRGNPTMSVNLSLF